MSHSMTQQLFKIFVKLWMLTAILYIYFPVTFHIVTDKLNCAFKISTLYKFTPFHFIKRISFNLC